MGVDYPGKLRKLVNNLPVMPHIALKAYINGTWVLLDATWDPPLKKVGFPVNENWDGISDMLNAVPLLEEVIHEDIQDRLDYLDYFDSKIPYTEEQDKLVEEFCSELNDWLAKVRTE